MNTHLFDAYSDCSSELSETQSELEARVYGITHHNDFSGTTESPSIDSKYRVEFNPNGEVIVFLMDSSDIVKNLNSELPELCNDGIIPKIVLDDNDNDDNTRTSRNTSAIGSEFSKTSLKKKRKRKKKKLNDTSVDEYVSFVRETNALEEYKEKSGLNKMEPRSSHTDNVALNVTFRNKRTISITQSEVLRKDDIITRPTECTLSYRCPESWTPEMIEYYTKIDESKLNFSCKEELRKITEKTVYNPSDWALNPMDLYKSHSNTPRIRCNICRQFGHTMHYCDRYKPEVCIMCGIEGHNFRNCNDTMCLTCGTRQDKFIRNCSTCIEMSQVKCNICNEIGHKPKFCPENWRKFHSTITSPPKPSSNEFAQSSSRSNVKERQSKKFVTSSTSTPDATMVINKSPTTDNSKKSTKRLKWFQRIKEKKRLSRNKNNLTTSDNESINIDVNIQDVTCKRTLTKKNFF